MMLKYLKMIAVTLAVSTTLASFAKSKDDDDDYDSYESYSFFLDAEDFPETVDGKYYVLTQYLPDGIEVEWTGKKFKTPKAGKPKVVKDDGEYDIEVNEKGEDNPCGLKISYKKKTGKVSGSFKVYAWTEGKKGKPKIKSYSGKFSGYFGDEDGLNVTIKKIGRFTAWLE